MPYPLDGRPTGTAFLVAVALAIAFAIIYLVGVRGFQEDSVHRESIYNPEKPTPEKPTPDAYLQVNASVLSIEPLADRLTLKLTFTPKGGLSLPDGRTPKQDIHIRLFGAGQTRELWWIAGQRPQPVTVTVGLSGTDTEGGEISQYPFDRYVARLEVLVQGGTAPTTSAAAAELPGAAPRVPTLLVFDTALHGFNLESKMLPDSQRGDITLELSARRSRTFVGLILFMNAVMAIMALAAILVAGAAAFGRRVEFTMILWAGALLFVFPAIRAALPGSPPTGVLGDFLVFFWAILLTALSMALLVLLWLRRED